MTARPVRRLWAPFMRGRGTIFFLHRFSDPDLGVVGHDPALLHRALAYLRRERYELVDLVDLFGRLRRADSRVDRAVAFTMDDGYLDQATVGGEVFAHFDCPVTTFVTTAFLDGMDWMWWDRIEYVFDHTARPTLEITFENEALRYVRAPAIGYEAAQADFTERCKTVPNASRVRAIQALAAAAEVEVPVKPPLRYAPLTWSQARALERRGMRFGPHTVTHPILSRTSPLQSEREIADSWQRVQAEVSEPVSIFCYPNGQSQDFGSRETTTLRTLGFAGAVVGSTGYATSEAFAAAPDGPFRVQRFGYPDDLRRVAQCASGLDRVNQLLRGYR